MDNLHVKLKEFKAFTYGELQNYYSKNGKTKNSKVGKTSFLARGVEKKIDIKHEILIHLAF